MDQRLASFYSLGMPCPTLICPLPPQFGHDLPARGRLARRLSHPSPGQIACQLARQLAHQFARRLA
jgi:hypothetical protein